MSVLRDYYGSGLDKPDMNPEADFAETIIDAVEWSVKQLMERWNEDVGEDWKTLGCIPVEEIPGYEFGFRPMELRVLSANRPTKKFPNIHNVKIYDLLSGEHQAFSVEVDDVMGFLQENGYGYTPLDKEPDDTSLRRLKAAANNKLWYYADKIAKSPVFPIYSVSTGLTTGKRNTGNQFVPVVYNMEFGTVYFAKLEMKLFTRGCPVHVALKEWAPIVSVNLINGDVKLIGQMADMKSSEKKEWGLHAPHGMMCPWMEPIVKKYYDSEEMGSYYSKAGIYFEYPKGDAIFVIQACLQNPKVHLGKLVGGGEEKYDPSYANRTQKLDYLWGSIWEDWSCYSMLNSIYEQPADQLFYKAESALQSDKNGFSNWMKLIHCFGPLTQDLMQAPSKWLILSLETSLRYGRPVYQGYKSIREFLGLNKPDYKWFLSRETDAELVFFLNMNEVAPTSRAAFEKAYAKAMDVETALSKYGETCRDAFEPYFYSGVSINAKNTATIRGKNGRVLFQTRHLPKPMCEYTNKHMNRSGISVYQYFKYLADETKAARDAGVCIDVYSREDRTTIKVPCDWPKIQRWLADYNRMAKEIMPNTPFILPHSLMHAHDNMVDNYNRIIKDRASGAAVNDVFIFAKCYQNKDCSVYSDDEFVMTAPTCSMDLYEEGIELNHCVGSYTEEIAKNRGSMLIYFLRKKAAPKKPLVTVQVDWNEKANEFQLTEIAGKGNRLPTTPEMNFFKAWLEEFNADYKKRKEKKLSEKAKDFAYFDTETINLVAIYGIDIQEIYIYRKEKSIKENYIDMFTEVCKILANRMESGDMTIEQGDAFVKHLASASVKHKLTMAEFEELKKLLRLPEAA